MDSLCLDLQLLIGQFQSATEYCLVYNQDVEKCEADPESLKKTIITKDWRWLIELSSYDHFRIRQRLKVLMCAWGDLEVQEFQKFRLTPTEFHKLSAAAIRGDVERFRLYAESDLLDKYGSINFTKPLYYALYYNNTQIIDEYFKIYNHIQLRKYDLELFIYMEEFKYLYGHVDIQTMEHFWAILIRQGVVNEDSYDELKQKLFSVV